MIEKGKKWRVKKTVKKRRRVGWRREERVRQWFAMLVITLNVHIPETITHRPSSVWCCFLKTADDVVTAFSVVGSIPLSPWRYWQPRHKTDQNLPHTGVTSTRCLVSLATSPSHSITFYRVSGLPHPSPLSCSSPLLTGLSFLFFSPSRFSLFHLPKLLLLCVKTVNEFSF